MNSGPPTLRVVGCHVNFYVASRGDIPTNVDNLLALLASYSELPVIRLSVHFNGYAQLTEWMQAHPSARVAPSNDRVIYDLSCALRDDAETTFLGIPAANKDGDYLRVDPITLEPIGMSQFKSRNLVGGR